MNKIVGAHGILLITLDTLRYDVAVGELEKGNTPNLAAALPGGKWEKRHSPGNFTYSAHQAFFAGFLPTPATPGLHSRLFAARFPGSETTANETFEFDAPDLVTGLRQAGYYTACIGGVGFFNKQSPLGSVMPDLFNESHWDQSLGVTDPNSTENQVNLALERISATDEHTHLFLFLNVSALHQPNCIFSPGAKKDSIETHAAALDYVDTQIDRLFNAMASRADTFCIVFSDHGTAYGEEGYTGHRLCHPVVWTVPYGHFILKKGTRI
jgi:hypothetical protein